MKRLFRLLLLVCLSLSLALPAVSLTGPRGSHSSRSSSRSSHRSSKKSHTTGSNDGRYQGGRGSSHKGGHYKNQKTGNHYRDRKAGTPK